jgi:hypothetical protein
MGKESNLYSDSFAGIAKQILDSTQDLLFANPDTAMIDAILSVLEEDVETDVRMLVDEATSREAFDDFLIAARTAEATEGPLELRIADTDGVPLVVTDDEAIVPIAVSGSAAGLRDTDNGFVAAARKEYNEVWDGASVYSADMAGISSICNALEKQANAEVRRAFEQALTNAKTLGTRDDVLDVVTLGLLIGAKYEIQLYDLGEWGEETGVGSKATFSRMKTQLEEGGLITTESVPGNIGRPRLRLKLVNDALLDVDEEDFAQQARTHLQEIYS